MNAVIDPLLAALALPSLSLPALFLISLLSATLLPMGSEPALFAVVKVNPALFWPALVVATLGNTIGGAISYGMGFGAKNVLAKERESRWFGWMQRFGPKTLLLSWLPADLSGLRLLDAGCGTGDLLAMAAGLEAGALLLGLDPDEDSLELASHKIPSTLHPVELHQGVAEAMPFEDGSFDLVTATNLFGGLEPRTRARALDECFRVLRPGGRLLVADKADQPDGLEGLLLAPWVLVRDAIFPGASAVPTLAEAIAIAGFEAPASRGRVRTLVGTSEILEAFKPLQG